MNAARAIARLQRSGLRAVTTSEAAALWGSTGKAAAEMLRRFAVEGIVQRVRRGLWVMGTIDPLTVAERIAEPDLAYLSSLTALRLRGMIEQIPTDIHVATTGRARRVQTPLGRFAFHHLQSPLFGGWERLRGLPVATPEKALFDTLYWATSRGRRVGRLPELTFPPGFDRRSVTSWIERIPSVRLRGAVRSRLEAVLPAARRRR